MGDEIVEMPIVYGATPTVAAQQCGLPEGLDATDMDMIRRGDMLGPVLGARVASLIQSQAARIAALEAGLGEFADPANWVVDGRFDPHSGNFDATTFARSVLNGERKG